MDAAMRTTLGRRSIPPPFRCSAAVRAAGGPKTRLALLISLLLLAAYPAFAEEPDPPERPKGDSRFALSITDEASVFTGLRAEIPSLSNLLLAQPSFSYRRSRRWRFSTSLAGLAHHYDETHVRLRVNESYLSLSAGSWDVAAGKRIVRWGTGYAFSPTGVLDPPRNPTDPADRLNLNEGREMVAVDGVVGRHSVTAAWASAGLVARHRPGMRETAAFRYDTLVAGVDASVICARDRGGAGFVGANFTGVIGSAVEIHGEFARRRGREDVIVPGLENPLPLPNNTRTALVVGGKFTHRSGVGVLFEFYSSSGLLRMVDRPAADAGLPLTERRHYAFARVGKSRLRERPGWKEWDISAMILASLSDGSRMLILDFERRVGNRFSVLGRASLPAGTRWRSEYGMIPYSSQITVGCRFHL